MNISPKRVATVLAIAHNPCTRKSAYKIFRELRLIFGLDMHYQPDNLRALRRAALLTLAGVVSWIAGASGVEASILMPETGVFTADAEQLVADFEKSQMGDQSSAGSSTSQESPSPQQEPVSEREVDLAQQLAAMLASQAEGSSTGGTSSSNGPTGTSGGATLLAEGAVLLANPSLTERYAGEQSLFLPDAPGNELLRPPQV